MIKVSKIQTRAVLIFGGCFLLSSIPARGANPAVAAAAPGKSEMRPESTYLFWTPRPPPSHQRGSMAHQQLDALNRWLATLCGGYSRWEIDGGWIDPATQRLEGEPGYFYWVSCAKLTPDILNQQLISFFQQKENYIVRMRGDRFVLPPGKGK